MGIRNHINFRMERYTLKELAYGDCVYAWLLLHSYYNPEEKHNYIYIDKEIIRQYKYNGKICYKIPYYSEFEELDGETTFQLLCLPLKEQKEELIKTYAILLKKKRAMEKEGKKLFYCSAEQLIKECGKTATHTSTYDKMRGILTVLQGAGIIKFRTILAQ